MDFLAYDSFLVHTYEHTINLQYLNYIAFFELGKRRKKNRLLRGPNTQF